MSRNTKTKPKQPYMPFAPVANKMHNAAVDQNKKKERTKTTAFVRHGNDDPKKTRVKPKDWAFSKPPRKERAKKVKLNHVAMVASELCAELLEYKAGLPECRWFITSASPYRKLTARDVLYLLGYYTKHPNGIIEVEYNESHRVLNILDDLGHVINTDAENELATPTTDQ